MAGISDFIPQCPSDIRTTFFYIQSLKKNNPDDLWGSNQSHHHPVGNLVDVAPPFLLQIFLSFKHTVYG